MKEGRTSARLQLMAYGNHLGSFCESGQALRRIDADFGILPVDAIRRSFSAGKVHGSARGYGCSYPFCIARMRPEGLKGFGVAAPIGSRTSRRENVTLWVAVNHGPNRISVSR